MTTDYDLPAWFFDDDTTDQDRCQWMRNERMRRQEMRNDPDFRHCRRLREQIRST